ncbi:hypothetical protein BZA77DRAFT_303719 [Pyronema omphalodes]|nr:hypothetical protein BZA77DRAFT_303719 [Pyronema omphalodes]
MSLTIILSLTFTEPAHAFSISLSRSPPPLLSSRTPQRAANHRSFSAPLSAHFPRACRAIWWDTKLGCRLRWWPDIEMAFTVSLNPWGVRAAITKKS